MTDKTRKDFEAWLVQRKGPTGDTPGYPGSTPFYHDQEDAAWEGYQTATQQSAARIAALEADVAHKDAFADQLGRELSNADSKCRALEAEVMALRKDAERYRAFFDAGLPITFMGVEYYTKPDLDADIDTAIEAERGEG